MAAAVPGSYGEIFRPGSPTADGTLKNYLTEQPFPLLDPNDPEIALKAIWNFSFRPGFASAPNRTAAATVSLFQSSPTSRVSCPRRTSLTERLNKTHALFDPRRECLYIVR